MDQTANDSLLAGRTLVVTGAGSGIGAATAALASARGAKVIATDARPERIARSEAGPHQSLPLDVTRPDDWERLAAKLAEQDLVCDALAHCAGIADASSLATTEAAAFRRVVEVNLEGSFLASRFALRHAGKDSAVVLVSSATAHRPMPTTAAYASSKAAVLALAKVAALEGAERRIRFNTVSPGGVTTAMWTEQEWWPAHRAKHDSDDAAFTALAEATPLHRFASAEEIGAQIVHLLSDASAFVTGTDLVLDGGHSIA